MFIYRIRVGQDHQAIGINLLRQQRGGEVFINNRFCALPVLKHWNPAAAATYHRVPLVQQTLNRLALLNPHRRRRRNHPTHIFTVALHPPAILAFQLFLQLRIVNRTNELLRRRKGRIA